MASKRLPTGGIQLSPLLRKCRCGHPREGLGEANRSGMSSEPNMPLESTGVGSD
jgi:hypothetical protein